ncbi:hypothetical protein ACIBQ1_46185 [Nonomuraea sp. NPDC050153]|uniref:hypothetical protein n=1 Tax=Nonomuraea sp. NPDC050153 TaxID=3364359 RepID=UPI00379F890B
MTPSLLRTPLATTSITRRTESFGPTTGSAGRTVIARMAGSIAAEGAGTVSGPAASETRRRLLVMIETVGTAR